jgi:transposase InsO family protein
VVNFFINRKFTVILSKLINIFLIYLNTLVTIFLFNRMAVAINLSCSSFKDICKDYSSDELNQAFAEFKDHLVEYFAANAIVHVPQQIAILKLLTGKQYCKTIPPAFTPLANTFDQYCDAINLSFAPANSQIFSTFKMDQLKQLENESIDTYVDKLHRMAKNSTYTDAERDKVILSCMAKNVYNNKVKIYILSQQNPTVADVLARARTIESVAASLSIMEKDEREDAINAISSAEQCEACGENHGPESHCRGIERECYNCFEKGHIAKMCKQPRRISRNTPQSYPFQPPNYMPVYRQMTPIQQPNQQIYQQSGQTVRPSMYHNQFYQPRDLAPRQQYNTPRFQAYQQYQQMAYQNQPYAPLQHQQYMQQMQTQHNNRLPRQFQQQMNTSTVNSIETKEEKIRKLQEQIEQLNNVESQEINNDANANTVQLITFADEIRMEGDEQQPDFYNNSFHDHMWVITEEILSLANVNQKLACRRVIMCGNAMFMMLDTGASVNVITASTYKKMKNKPPLTKPSKLAFGYNSKEPIPILGEFLTSIKTRKKHVLERVLVLNGEGRNILGLSAAKALGLVIIPEDEICHISKLTTLAEKFKGLFALTIGLIKDVLVKLNINMNVKPIQAAARRIPYGDREAVEKELHWLLHNQIIERVPAYEPTPWLNVMTIQRKRDGTPRICLDSRALNTAVIREHGLMYTPEDIRYMINGSTILSKLDMNKAYFQLMLDPESRYITCFLTSIGILRFTRMFMGLNTSSAIFQRVIYDKIKHLQGVLNVSDDVLVYGNENTHDQRLDDCCEALQTCGATIGLRKCKIGRTKIKFHGIRFSGIGMAPTRDRVRALVKSTKPNTQSEINSILGMINFSSGFIKDLATIGEPLRRLARTTGLLIWNEECDQAWENIKTCLTTRALAHFNPEWLTQVVVDASPVGLGSILQQVNPENSNDTRVIKYDSRKLTDVESRYPHIEKESAACVYGCEKNHLYVANIKFKLFTDNKPVELLFNNPSSKPSARIQKMAVRLAQYEFEIIHKPGYYNEADFLSRQPVDQSDSDSDSEDEYENDQMESHINSMIAVNIPSCITHEELILATKQCDELQEVIKFMRTEQVTKLHDSLQAYTEVISELTITSDNILIRNFKIVIPKSLRLKVIKQAHLGHQGSTKTLALLNNTCWFPAARKLVDIYVSKCNCQLDNRKPRPYPVIMSELPDGPWSRVSSDYYGPTKDGMHLMHVICQYSRYPVTVEISSTCAKLAIIKFEQIFKDFGYPREMRHDNGAPYNAVIFKQYLKDHGIKDSPTCPENPAGNGLVENFNKVIVKVMRMAELESRPWRAVLTEALLAYRTTPHTTTGYPPATLMFNRVIRGNLPILPQLQTINIQAMHETVKENDRISKEKMAKYADEKRHAKQHNFHVGQMVWILNKRNRNIRLNKNMTNFSDQKLRIIAIKGSMITAENVQFKNQITRVSSFFTPNRQENLSEALDELELMEQQYLGRNQPAQANQQQMAQPIQFQIQQQVIPVPPPIPILPRLIPVRHSARIMAQHNQNLINFYTTVQANDNATYNKPVNTPKSIINNQSSYDTTIHPISNTNDNSLEDEWNEFQDADDSIQNSQSLVSNRSQVNIKNTNHTVMSQKLSSNTHHMQPIPPVPHFQTRHVPRLTSTLKYQINKEITKRLSNKNKKDFNLRSLTKTASK